MGKILLEGYECERCGHQWYPNRKRSGDRPSVCPSCASPYWDKPRKLQRVTVEDKASETVSGAQTPTSRAPDVG